MLFAISYLPLYGYLLLHGNAVGFTEMFNYAKKLKMAFNRYLNTNFHILNVKQSKEKPLILGYDVINRQVKSIERYVAIFDTPPRTLDGSMTHSYTSVMGSRIDTIELVEEYLLDCIKVSIELGFNIALKPKYSSPNYHGSYKKLLEKIQGQYRDRVIIIDPNTKMDSIANLTVGSISMPYSSTKYFFENSGKESIFYFPIRYESVFRKNYAVNITFGTKNLESFLLNL
jgi:polysaccharide biosynthesis PFTS motif protein